MDSRSRNESGTLNRPMWRGAWYRCAVVVAVASIGPSAFAADRTDTIELCIADQSVSVEVSRAIDESVVTARVEVRPGSCEASKRDRFVGRFETRNGEIYFVLAARRQRLWRRVPWLNDADAGLHELARRGRLSAFGVLVDGLVAELLVWRRRDRLSQPTRLVVRRTAAPELAPIVRSQTKWPAPVVVALPSAIPESVALPSAVPEGDVSTRVAPRDDKTVLIEAGIAMRSRRSQPAALEFTGRLAWRSAFFGFAAQPTSGNPNYKVESATLLAGYSPRLELGSNVVVRPALAVFGERIGVARDMSRFVHTALSVGATLELTAIYRVSPTVELGLSAAALYQSNSQKLALENLGQHGGRMGVALIILP